MKFGTIVELKSPLKRGSLRLPIGTELVVVYYTDKYFVQLVPINKFGNAPHPSELIMVSYKDIEKKLSIVGLLTNQENALPSEDDHIEITFQELPTVEKLSLAISKDQLIISPKVELFHTSLENIQSIIQEFQTYKSAKAFLNDYQVNMAPVSFSRHLPRIRYRLDQPCPNCHHSYEYTRKASTRADTAQNHFGYLHCVQCLHGEYIDLKGKLVQFRKKDSPKEPLSAPRQHCQYIEAVLKRYAPEYQCKKVNDFMSGKLSLNDVQEETGIWL